MVEKSSFPDQSTLQFEKGAGLIPAVVQDFETAEVLMLGFMNREAYEKTVETGKVTFFSRTRGTLWTKGETSGNFLDVAAIRSDCDNDTLLITAKPKGPVCHTGARTCFRKSHPDNLQFLGTLSQVVRNRLQEGASDSYTKKLADAGTKRIAQKVGEEGLEVALSATASDRKELVSESADLLYHLIVLLEHEGLSLLEVAAELSGRHREE